LSQAAPVAARPPSLSLPRRLAAPLRRARAPLRRAGRQRAPLRRAGPQRVRLREAALPVPAARLRELAEFAPSPSPPRVRTQPARRACSSISPTSWHRPLPLVRATSVGFHAAPRPTSDSHALSTLRTSNMSTHQASTGSRQSPTRRGIMA